MNFPTQQLRQQRVAQGGRHFRKRRLGFLAEVHNLVLAERIRESTVAPQERDEPTENVVEKGLGLFHGDARWLARRCLVS